MDYPDDIPDLHLDSAQFKRVLINLFDNAIEAMGREGVLRIGISLDHENERAVFEVSDTGPGITDMDKERLFQPYFSTKKEGTGLGLAISDRIIAEHGGTIRVSDNIPQGSVFTIELPLSG